MSYNIDGDINYGIVLPCEIQTKFLSTCPQYSHTKNLALSKKLFLCMEVLKIENTGI
ncbi:hypothetical protein JL09_g5042 [Pichia kudriavzevii]|uniref:Uncharacterized protein n=1 Tax=Pichia kudriavzevii TaxID=4909 RepID=A0A099NSK5_PICKU|nr:hypothetical protein JL09_g5042 [Pichia kudriavzevii]